LRARGRERVRGRYLCRRGQGSWVRQSAACARRWRGTIPWPPVKPPVRRVFPTALRKCCVRARAAPRAHFPSDHDDRVVHAAAPPHVSIADRDHNAIVGDLYLRTTGRGVDDCTRAHAVERDAVTRRCRRPRWDPSRDERRSGLPAVWPPCRVWPRLRAEPNRRDRSGVAPRRMHWSPFHARRSARGRQLALRHRGEWPRCWPAPRRRPPGRRRWRPRPVPVPKP
jgi:hypothetical protein